MAPNTTARRLETRLLVVALFLLSRVTSGESLCFWPLFAHSSICDLRNLFWLSNDVVFFSSKRGGNEGVIKSVGTRAHTRIFFTEIYKTGVVSLWRLLRCYGQAGLTWHSLLPHPGQRDLLIISFFRMPGVEKH